MNEADDRRSRDKKDAIRKIKRNPFSLVFAFIFLPIFLMNLATAIIAGQVLYAGRFTTSQWITYRDHPVAFVCMVAVSIGGVLLGAGTLRLLYFKKID
jgi:hypothetical protein